MGVYEELVERGLIAQVTDEKEIRELVNNGLTTVRQPSISASIRRRIRCMSVISWRLFL